MTYKCGHCDKEFETKEAVDMHSFHKHSVAQPRSFKLKKMHKIYLSILLIAIIIISSSYVLSKRPGKYDEFAQCLTDKGVKFYGAFWCPHCAAEKQLFGKSMRYVNYIECSTPDGQGQTNICIKAGIKSYPTFEFADGTRDTGEIPLEELSSKSGCELPQ